jgi:NitT/TauT family transport system substrate-binding protein
MPGGNREYVRKLPIATRRVMRAILKATDLCAQEPARVVQNTPNRGLLGQYDYHRQALSELPYYKSREYNAEDTIRFYSLRLYEERTFRGRRHF